MDLKDPDISHLHAKHFQDVYEPSDDSYLFMDALREDAPFINTFSDTNISCLEVGSGSGIVSAHFSAVLDRLQIHHTMTAVDVNPLALKATSATYLNNKVKADCVRSDLTSCIRSSSIDVILFNPPYVPTGPEEMLSFGIEAAWAGGENGRKVIDRFLLKEMPRVVRAKTLLYLVLIEANIPSEVIGLMQSNGFDEKLLKEKKSYREKLRVYRFWR